MARSYSGFCAVCKKQIKRSSKHCPACIPRRSVEQRFMLYVEPIPEGKGCWEWTGTIHPKYGYGYITVGSKKDGTKRPYHAHRFSWEYHIGPIPKGLIVCHKCDNKTCVNPDHLFLGTPADNSRDMVAKGRQARGESHGRRKIGQQEADDIRNLLGSGVFQEEIAKRFSVSQSLVSLIKLGKIWTS
jgi:hypothetical protein